MNNNKEHITFELIEILENVTIIYFDGKEEQFDAVWIRNTEIVIGRILNDGIFLECGGIPKENVNHIKNGAKRKIFRKNLTNGEPIIDN